MNASMSYGLSGSLVGTRSFSSYTYSRARCWGNHLASAMPKRGKNLPRYSPPQRLENLMAASATGGYWRASKIKNSNPIPSPLSVKSG